MDKLKDKVVLVLGSSSGMGAASAKLFAQEGAKVVMAARRTEKGNKVAEDIRRFGGEATFITCDATDPKQVKNLCEKAVSSYGRLDLAMNCQGWNRVSLIRDTEPQLFDDIIKVCLNSMFYAIKYEADAMLKTGGGAIVNISSVNATLANNYQAAYCAAKGGLDMLTNVAALEYGPENIRINTINPGMTVTEMVDGFFANDRAVNEFRKGTPLRMFAKPEDIAKIALFLLSDDAKFITGEHMSVDGGLNLEGFPDVFRICLDDEERYK